MSNKVVILETIPRYIACSYTHLVVLGSIETCSLVAFRERDYSITYRLIYRTSEDHPSGIYD